MQQKYAQLLFLNDFKTQNLCQILTIQIQQSSKSVEIQSKISAAMMKPSQFMVEVNGSITKQNKNGHREYVPLGVNYKCVFQMIIWMFSREFMRLQAILNSALTIIGSSLDMESKIYLQIKRAKKQKEKDASLGLINNILVNIQLMDKWKCKFQGKQTVLPELISNYQPYTFSQEKQPEQELNLMKNGQMARINQTKCLSNYFAIPNDQSINVRIFQIKSHLQLMVDTLWIKGLQHYFMHYRTEEQEKYFKQLSLLNSKDFRGKKTMCFSRKWREKHLLIFLIINVFQNKIKVPEVARVQILSNKGFILQTFINTNCKDLPKDLASIINKHYKLLKNVVIYSNCHSVIDIDQFLLFQQLLPNTKVTLISYNSPLPTQQVQLLEIGRVGQVRSEEDCRIVELGNYQICILLAGKINNNYIKSVLLSLNGILTNERYIEKVMDVCPYQSEAFCRKQFLLRMFVFYFNFISSEDMLPQDKKQLMNQIITRQLQSLSSSSQEESAKKGEVITHSYTTHQYPLICEICNKKTKVTCLKCCQSTQVEFGICKKDCFEKFHTSLDQYIGQIRRQNNIENDSDGSSNEDSPQEQALETFPKNKRKYPGQKDQKGGSKSGDRLTDKLRMMKSIDELRDKWKKQIMHQEKHMALFCEYASLSLTSPIVLSTVQRIDCLVAQMNGVGRVKKEEEVEPS